MSLDHAICANCGLTATFPGFDDCLRCSIASLLIEQPEYLAWAERVYAHDKGWIGQVRAEWNRQSSALVSCGLQSGRAA